MKGNKKLTVIAVLAVTVCVCASATAFKTPEVKYTNLKVLPKNISSRDLQSIMVDDFQDGLGVTCGFCHANAPDGHGLDFASDAKPEKEISRQMIRMTLGINKKYLMLKHPAIGSPGLVVSCNTCHRGEAFPEGSEPK